MEETIKTTDIKNGDLIANVPHGKSDTDIVVDSARGETVPINSVVDSSNVTVSKGSATTETTEEAAIRSNGLPAENSNEEDSEVNSANDSPLVDSTGSSGSISAQERIACPESGDKISEEFGNQADNVSGTSAAKQKTISVEIVHETTNRPSPPVGKETALETPVVSANSMEVEEQQEKQTVVATDSISETTKKLEIISAEQEQVMPPPSVANETILVVPAGSTSSMELEEPSSNPSGIAVTMQDQGTEQQVLDTEAVKMININSSVASTGAMEVESHANNCSTKTSALGDQTILVANETETPTSMEVEEQQENPIVVAIDNIGETTKEQISSMEQQHAMLPPPSVAVKKNPVTVEGPSANVSGIARSLQDQTAEQQQLETAAVKTISTNSLSLLTQYSGSSDSESEDTDATNSVKVNSPSSSSSDESEDEHRGPDMLSDKYRKCGDAVLQSDAETMDTVATSSDEDDEDPQNQRPIRTKGEILVDEMPPIEELTITVPETECKPIGLIDSIVAQIVLVQSIPGVELLNLDTVLFLDRGKRSLGKIFDVIGQVNCPMYCVLFNSNQEVLSKNITVGMQVYCAPATEHTSFIILSELMRFKGSDASWMNDNEPPPHMVEYSDDEAEKTAKKNRKKKSGTSEVRSGENSQQEQEFNQQQPSHHYQQQQQQQNYHYQNHQHQQQQQFNRQQQFQYPYMARPHFRRPPPSNRGNFYPQQRSGYSWHHNVHNPRYIQPQQFQQQLQYHQQHHFLQQVPHPPPQQQQFPNPQSGPGGAFLPNPFAMFGQQPPNPPS